MFSSNTSSAEGGYQISRSLRFNSADSAYLSRTPASAGNRKTWTLSLWFKRSALPSSGYQSLIGADSGGGQSFYVAFDNSSQQLEMGQGASVYRKTTQVFRDPSAWYHIVVALDTTQATADDRIKIYVNGAQITAFGTTTNPSQNSDLAWNSNVGLGVGADIATSGARNFFNGYLTEINFIDGQQLTPSSFGETNAQTGVWQPKAYSGSYGTNGYYLNFSDNSNTTAATLGKDYSGNGNNWTPNNFSVAAGAGNDSMVDTPTPYGVDTGAGGEVRGNYATLNSLGVTGVYGTYTNGNLDWQSANSDQRAGVSTFPANTGGSDMWYCEVTIGSKTSSYYTVGVFGNTNNCYSTGPNVYWRQDGPLTVNGSQVATGQTYTQGDVIGLAYDNSAGQMRFYKNGSLVSSYTQNFTSTSRFFFGCGSDSSGSTANYSWNFGQRPFAYTAPSGFKALCTQNLPTPTIGATSTTLADDYFNTVLYTGDRTARTISVGFQPDWVWVKSRNAADDHYLMNAVVGTGKYLSSNSIASETTNAATLTAYTSDGFSVGNTGTTNETGRTYVAWNWKANGAGSTNTAGSITSTVSANTTSGFSIVTWTGNSANATIGHGLGAAPSMVIIKYRGTTDAWYVYHTSTGANKYLVLNSTDFAQTNTNIWQNTAPTSTVFSIGFTNNQSTIVAYCFAPVAGYSAFGSYTGNGSTDGPFVFTGFRPAFVMVKRTDTTSNWTVLDSKRIGYNADNNQLYPNLSDAEATTDLADLLSNGFKSRSTDASVNASGGTYIYMALAENPFKFSLAR